MGFLGRLMAGLGMRAEHPPRSGEQPRVDIRRLEATLSTAISRPEYFEEALTHRSYLQMPHMQGGSSNERLEFLGDAVLSLIVGEYLFHRHRDAPEGELTKIRSRLVNRKALSIMASGLSLGDFMLLSPAAMQLGDKGMDTILSDAFEAVIGAIYLDGGYASAKEFVNRCIENALAQKLLSIGDDNFKSQLLEYTQSLGLGTPKYHTMRQDGPDHDRTFTVEVHIGDRAYGAGSGKNKKDAEQSAAGETLAILAKDRHISGGDGDHHG
jgi:ribonuclease-3